MYLGKKVSVIIPTYNEEKSIEGVINGFFNTGVVDEVIAVDNNARGDTAGKIRATKATYVLEKDNQGYGHAIMRGLDEATGELLVMVEADGTFDPEDINKLLIYSRDFPAVFGTRTSKAAIWSGAFMPWSVRFGNWFFAKILEVLHNGPTLTDIGCTYKLITREVYNSIHEQFKDSKGDGTFSPEIMIWILRKGWKPIEIPVNYKPRIGESMYTGSTIRAAKLGIKMLWKIFIYRFKKI